MEYTLLDISVRGKMYDVKEPSSGSIIIVLILIVVGFLYVIVGRWIDKDK
ncbi:hypothetical protein M2101_002302 [Parabacteroides sp. PM5-20]|nr:hypothetical protein [Parabacteroides sp. PM5-20]